VATWLAGHFFDRTCVICMCVSLALNLPANVEDVCPNIPSLEKLMEEIVDLAESGIRYTQMPHVMEVVLPMLCSYMSRWWEHGPENNPGRAEMCCTALNSEHMNTLLGNILKIIYNNLGIDEGAWMKRLAGKTEKQCAIYVLFSERFKVQKTRIFLSQS